MGDYAKAEPLYRRALAICEKALGAEHPDTATSLNNLAALYYAQWATTRKPSRCMRRALKIREKALGPEHPDTATSLNNLAELYDRWATTPRPNRCTGARWRFAKKRSARSIPIPQRASTTWRSFTDHGRLRQSRTAVAARLGIREKALGAEHPDTATSLNNLAGLYRSMGDYAKPNRSCSARWKSARKRSAPSIPSPRNLTTSLF